MRAIKSANNLMAQVEGDIEDVRLRYRFKVPRETREKVDRVLASYAEKCPAYQSVKGCIECSWDAEILEE